MDCTVVIYTELREKDKKDFIRPVFLHSLMPYDSLGLRHSVRYQTPPLPAHPNADRSSGQPSPVSTNSL